jgi:hypothetical protein
MRDMSTREYHARYFMRQGVAHDLEMRPATARVLPNLVVVASRVQPVIDIFVPGIEIL